jgi:heptosyltransferase-3
MRSTPAPEAGQSPAPRTILVISLRYFGDVLLATPLIRSLRRAYPGAHIDALLFAGTEGMLEGNPDVRGVATIPERPSGAEQRALVHRLWRKYDLAVIAETGDRPHLYGWIAAVARTGLLPPQAAKRWWKQRLLAQSVTASAYEPRFEAYGRLVRSMGLDYQPAVVAPTAGVSAQELCGWPNFDAAKERYAVLHLAPRFRYKRWRADGWRDLISWLRQRGLQVVVTGGSAQVEREYVEQVLGGSANEVVNLSGRLRFAQTADLLRSAALYVGPDTATTHLAAACGTPTLALYGPTDPGIWGPLPRARLEMPYARSAPLQQRGNVWVLQESSLPCVPCQQEGCERRRESYSACLDLMRAERVIEAARRLLNQTGA